MKLYMLTTEDALAKALTKSQKVIFWSKKNSFKFFFFANYGRYNKDPFTNQEVDVLPTNEIYIII